MEQEEYAYTPTTFDLETQSKDIQILKTFIPYLNQPKQKNFAMMVKFLELKNVMTLFDTPEHSLSMCSSDDPSERNIQLLNDLKKFCSPAEQDSIDMLLGAFTMLNFTEN